MDMEKVIKGVEHCFHGQECCGDIECPYYIEHLSDSCCLEDCQENLKADVIALLKEQEAQKFFVDESGKITPLPVVVRCKDCVHRGKAEKCVLAAISEEKDCPLFMLDNRGEWFCADGRRRDE